MVVLPDSFLLRGEIARLEAETAAPVDPLELVTLGQQWESGDVTQRAAVLNALWERIEVRADAESANGVVIVKLMARADRAANAHALVMTARQYIKRFRDEDTDSDSFHDGLADILGTDPDPDPFPGYLEDGGPGASLNIGLTGMDGNRTHPGRLSSAPQTVLKTAGPASTSVRRCPRSFDLRGQDSAVVRDYSRSGAELAVIMAVTPPVTFLS